MSCDPTGVDTPILQQARVVMIQLVYASRPFGFDAATLLDILFKARANNPKVGVTGCMICRDDLYLQILEGDEAAVMGIYDRIKRDDRHIELTELVRQPTTTRLFGKWSMRDDPVQSWMWTREEIDDGAVGRADPVEVMRIFDRLSKQEPETPG
jgi:hypothetical protein